METRRFIVLARILVVLTGLQVVAGAMASGRVENLDEEPAVRLELLLSEMLARSPQLAEARHRYDASLKRPSQERALPDPRITTGWVSAGNPLPGAGLGSEAGSNLGFLVSQEVPFPGKRDLRAGVALRESEQEAQAYRATALALIARLKTAFYELDFLYRSSDLLRANRELLRRLAKVAEFRYTSGDGVQQDLIKAQVEIAILETRLVSLERKKLSAAAEINSLLNRPLDAPLGRPEAIFLPDLPALEDLQVEAAQRSPSLRGQRAAVDGRKMGVDLARRDYYPDFDFMGGYFNQGGMKDMWEFKVQFNVPLFFAQKQRPALEESIQLLNQARSGFRREYQELGFRLRDRHVAARTARELMDLYGDLIVPQSNIALESSLAGYESGEVDFLSVLSNFSTILEYQVSRVEQETEYLKALAAIDELVGRGA